MVMVRCSMLMSALKIAALAPFFSCAFAPPKINTRAPSAATRPSLQHTELASYLDSLASARLAPAAPAVAAAAAAAASPGLHHAPLDYFALDRLTFKGPRAAPDWGTPSEWSRKLADDGTFRVGCWHCTEGGWSSPSGKAVTEVFYVLEGHGMLGDADGVKHYFGPGDVVVIPKGHTGRWDVLGDIHKLWAVNAHDNVEEKSPVIRVRVEHYKDFAGPCSEGTSATDPLYGSTGGVASASTVLYDVGPTQVGVWTCEPGGFGVTRGERQWFLVLEGTLFVTDETGDSSKRCVAGDTVMLPAGWTGRVDVVTPVKKLFTVAK